MIPDWLTEKLANPPKAGEGLHAWLFSCGRQLHAHMAPEAVEAVLAMAVAKADRRVPRREIRDAALNSAVVAWQQKDFSGRETCKREQMPGLRESSPAAKNLRWPKLTTNLRSVMLAASWKEGIGGLVDLWERSPICPGEGMSADDWIDWLFPDAEWLCLAVDHPATARTRRREKWSFGPADACGLIVPSPMTGPGGIGLDGKQSHRCLDNTGPRRWLVIEFDSGTIDEQAALHWQLRKGALCAGWPPLRLCVHSAGKSLHGWYGPVESEESARDLFGYAASIGADPPSWTRCQLMRLPGGVRKVGITDASLPDGWTAASELRKLEVFYFDPDASCTPILKSNFTAPGEGSTLAPLRILKAA